MTVHRWALPLVLVVVVSTAAAARADEPPQPGPRDRCPVCGMFVAGYPNWLAAVELEDGETLFFDGPKDMFRFLLEPGRYVADDVDEDDILAIRVTDYYTTRQIDGTTAFFVAGSDVNGPMGAELVPFATREDAETFRADHGGDAVLAFSDVGPEDIPR